MTPQELVREAIVSGKATNSADGVAYIKKHFGEDMRTQVFGRLQQNVHEELRSEERARGMNAVVGPHVEPVVQVGPTPNLYVALATLVKNFGIDKVKDAIQVVEAIRAI